MDIKINDVEVHAEEGWTLLDACKFYGIEIPTLCYHEGLTPGGVCRLCMVEIGIGKRKKLVTSCNHPVREDIEIYTHSEKVVRLRKMLIELLLARCPTSKILQDLAAKLGVSEVRFKVKNEDCILCGLCVRICEEQMNAKAIGFVGRGTDKKITTPFDAKSEVCRLCGACIYICPACQLRCQGPEAPSIVCGGCSNIEYPCLEKHGEVQCYLDPCAGCFLPSLKKEGKNEKAREMENKKR